MRETEVDNNYVMRDSDKFRKYNIVAKGIIEKRTMEFKDVWKNYKYIYQEESN